ncbi:ribonuclease H2, subunit B [Geopyxis carbonaria]|nr:ribonuclease H2, subunit B [Geopyxis carbonaria]
MSPRLCIIPTNPGLSGAQQSSTSDKQADSVVISLPHPRTAVPTRYLLHPTRGLHEFNKLQSSATYPRSWLLSAPETEDTVNGWIGNGQVIQDGSLYLTAPIDPLLMLLPHLLPTEGETERRYMPLDDLVETLVTTSKTEHWGHVIRPGSASRSHLEARIRTISEFVDVGGVEKAYRTSRQKVLRVLAKKCKAMAGKGGLPKSLEDEFVAKPLVRPVSMLSESLSLQTQSDESPTTEKEATEKEATEIEATEKEAIEKETPSDQANGQSKSPQENPPPDLVSEPAFIEDEASMKIRQLLRLRVSMQYLSANYLPPHVAISLEAHMSTLHDFKALDAHLAELKKLRAEAASVRSGDFSMKRSLDDEATDDRAEKKRKKEEEDKKKKKNVSRGVRDLGKVNTRGMAKMTSFFTKK